MVAQLDAMNLATAAAQVRLLGLRSCARSVARPHFSRCFCADADSCMPPQPAPAACAEPLPLSPVAAPPLPPPLAACNALAVWSPGPLAQLASPPPPPCDDMEDAAQEAPTITPGALLPRAHAAEQGAHAAVVKRRKLTCAALATCAGGLRLNAVDVLLRHPAGLALAPPRPQTSAGASRDGARQTLRMHAAAHASARRRACGVGRAAQHQRCSGAGCRALRPAAPAARAEHTFARR